MSFRIWMKNKQLKGAGPEGWQIRPTGPEILALQMLEVSHRLGRRQLEVLAPGGYMKRMTLAVVTVVALFLLLAVGATSASANTLTFNLTSDHCTGGCLPAGGSAGTIVLTDTGTGTVSVSVTLGSAFKFVSTGFQTDFGFNLTGTPTITYSGVTSGFAATGGSPQSAGSLMMDGTGSFQYGVTCTACGSGGSNPQTGPLNFTISGTGLSTASFTTNGANQYFAVDILGQGNTGAVDASLAPTVPDGGMTLMLLGGALVGLETLRRKFRV
jgi:hypothetical protein